MPTTLSTAAGGSTGAGVPSYADGTAGGAGAGSGVVSSCVVFAAGCELPVGPLRGGEAMPRLRVVCPVGADWDAVVRGGDTRDAGGAGRADGYKDAGLGERSNTGALSSRGAGRGTSIRRGSQGVGRALFGLVRGGDARGVGGAGPAGRVGGGEDACGCACLTTCALAARGADCGRRGSTTTGWRAEAAAGLCGCCQDR